MTQEFFDSHKFEWTDDNWYRLIPMDAIKERARRIKQLRKQGYKPQRSSLGLQLLSKGGIGSGKPHIEYWTRTYMISY